MLSAGLHYLAVDLPQPKEVTAPTNNACTDSCLETHTSCRIVCLTKDCRNTCDMAWDRCVKQCD